MMPAHYLFPLLWVLAVPFCYAAAGQPVEFAAAVSNRSLSADRPDTTESPYTVPPGMFQVEMSFFDYSRDTFDGVRGESWILGQINLKAGLAQDLDLQLVFDSYQEVKFTQGNLRQRFSGFGDVTVRLKKNVWGNDSGQTALAVLPYVSIPTGAELSSEVWQGGLSVPFSCTLTDRVNLGLMAQVDIVHDGESGGQDLEWLQSATLGIALTEELGMYLELVGIAGEDTDFFALFNTGLTFAMTSNWVFDAGVRIGLNRPAPDFGVFSGMTFRF